MKTSPFICSALAAAMLLALPSCKDGAQAPELSGKASLSQDDTAARRALAEKRAEVLSALALLPADVTDFATLTHIGDTLRRVVESGQLDGLTLDELSPELLALDSAALATTATPETYALLSKAIDALYITALGGEWGKEWAREATPAAAPIITRELVEAAPTAAGVPGGKPDASWQSFRVPASYAVITAKAGQEEMITRLCAEALSNLQKNTEPGVTPVNDANGFSGICIDLAARHQAAELPANAPEALMEAFMGIASNRKLYVLVRQQGAAFILALCEDPAELKLAASPAESVLLNDTLAPFDANLDKDFIAAVHAGKELTTLQQTSGASSLLKLVPYVGKVFSGLASSDAANKAAFDKAAAATELLGKAAGQFFRPADSPTTLQLWYDEDLHMEASFDAQGAIYEEGQLRLADMGAAPSTALYAEATPVRSGFALPGLPELAEAAIDLVHGFALTQEGSDMAELNMSLAAAQAFMPELRELSAACNTIGSGLDGHSALVIDSTPASLPALLGAPGQGTVEVPRLGLYVGVSERSMLSQGWDALLTTAGKILTKTGSDPSVIAMLPIVPSQVGSATSYSIALPFFTPDFVPNLTLNDKGMALGTSSKLNARMLESATGTAPFAGALFSLRFAPIADCLGSLAGADSPSGIAELATAAASAEAIAGVLEGIYGCSTVTNDVCTLKLKVSFTEPAAPAAAEATPVPGGEEPSMD